MSIKALERTHRQQLQTLCMPHAARQWLRWDDDRADTSGCFWPNSVVGEWLRTTYSVEKRTLSFPADFRQLTNDTDNRLDGGN